MLFLALLSAAAAQEWGFNYDRTSTGPTSQGGRDVTLGELFSALGAAAALAKLRADFSAMRALNGSAVRLFVNLPDLVSPPPLPAVNATFLGHLVSAVGAAAAAGLRVDLTGSTFERQAAAPAWNASSDEALLAARVLFWRAAAGALRGAPGVLNFNLVNEPFVPWGDFLHDVVTGCLPVARPSGARSTFCYLHPVFRHATAAWTRAVHALFPTPAALRAHWPDFPLPGEAFGALAIPRAGDAASCRFADYSAFAFNETRRWCAALAGAIRAEDPARRITVGVQFGGEGPDALTSRACADSVDFFSVHVRAVGGPRPRPQPRPALMARPPSPTFPAPRAPQIYPRSDFSSPQALEGYFTDRLNLLPENVTKNVTWEEFYPLGLASNITMEELPGIQARAAAAVRKPLAVTSRFSFYWGTAESLDLPPVSAAIYNQWLAVWAAARP